MTGIEQVTIKKAIAHRVGNPTRGEQLKLSAQGLTLNDESVVKILVHYFLHPFNERELYQFSHVSDVGLNEIFSYAASIFKHPAQLPDISQHIARYLYQRSTHARVKEGELYVVLFQDVPFENDFVNAVGIFKSESKETFLRVMEHGDNLELVGETGIDARKLDKGCLVFNTQEKDGFRVCIVDNTNKQQDAQYWVNDFLQVSPVSNDYRFTDSSLSLCKDFVAKELPEHFELTKGQQIELVHRSLDYFKEKEKFDLQEFASEVIQYPEMVDQFLQFKDTYARSKGISIDESFDIDLAAVNRHQKSFKSVLKLDRNFHVYIHGRRDMIERGYDKQIGKHFYKLYFDEEK